MLRVRDILSVILLGSLFATAVSADCRETYQNKRRHQENFACASGFLSIFVVPAPIGVPLCVWKAKSAGKTQDTIDLLNEIYTQGGEIANKLYKNLLKSGYAKTPQEFDKIKQMIKVANDRNLLCGFEDVLLVSDIKRAIKNGCLKAALDYEKSDYALLRTCIDDPKNWFDGFVAANPPETSTDKDPVIQP